MSVRFLLSQETECLTVVGQGSRGLDRDVVAHRFIEILAGMAPSLAGAPGVFNAYGRVYLDHRHLEFAAAECDSPYALALILERQERLAEAVLNRLKSEGISLALGNVNHDGLLESGASCWGVHENYLAPVSPENFGAWMLPFLATRLYAGAGGVCMPHGDFVASPRVIFLSQDVGGSTTQRRAIHSTCRKENLVGPERELFRYHLVLGDGNRSQFSQSLKVGTTLLAMHAVCRCPDWLRPLPCTPSPQREGKAFWVRAIRHFNRLAVNGESPRVNSVALRVQRIYLDAARRFCDSLPNVPDWTTRLLNDWEQTLGALASDDQPWLQRRLDPWIKHALFSAVLQERNQSWADVVRVPDVAYQLAMLNQNYHEFANPDSVFRRLESSGSIDHRVCPPTLPGDEVDPFVPTSPTRSEARARFIRDHSRESQWIMDWQTVGNLNDRTIQSLDDPFGREFASPIKIV